MDLYEIFMAGNAIYGVDPVEGATVRTRTCTDVTVWCSFHHINIHIVATEGNTFAFLESTSSRERCKNAKHQAVNGMLYVVVFTVMSITDN